MTVTVRLFATLREQAGWATQSVEISADETVQSLLARISDSETDLDLTNRPVYVAVNREYADPEVALNDGDEVAIFPPVSGGK